VPGESGLDEDSKLFSESNSRFVITCAPGDEAAVEALFKNVPCARVGAVLEEPRIRLRGENGRKLVDMDIEALRRAFKETLYGV
jgi:phosphoribosylformylglycinamidine synthase subunit PurSL